jgi:hypothetical protein
LYELQLSIPCENGEAEDAATEAVVAIAKQMFAMAQLMSHNATPRLKLTYHSARSGKVIVNIKEESPEPFSIISDSAADLRGQADEARAEIASQERILDWLDK